MPGPADLYDGICQVWNFQVVYSRGYKEVPAYSTEFLCFVTGPSLTVSH